MTLAVGLGGMFAALAAGATHAKTTAVRTSGALRPPALTTAPPAPLVEVSSPDGSASSQSAPAAAPTPAYEPPIVSSGGS